jgi:hypothetical protein
MTRGEEMKSEEKKQRFHIPLVKEGWSKSHFLLFPPHKSGGGLG